MSKKKKCPSSRRNTRRKSPEERPVCTLPLEEESRRILESTAAVQEELNRYYPQLLEQDLSEEGEMKADSIRRASSNLSKAAKETLKMQDELRGRILDVKQQRKKNKLIAAPANAAVDLKEEKLNHFAKGMNVYKLLLICFIGSFVGVVIETLWCLVTRGYIESRAGLVYGPFNLLYGIGAVGLTLCLYKFRNRGVWLSFFGGILVGSVVEYACSYLQELVFGSRSWDYSNIPFNLNGRICLLYSIFWGFLGVLWIKNLYPRLAAWILKIPNRAGKIATWVLLAFFVFNALMSGISMLRWTERQAGIDPPNAFWEWIDDRFPDERMERVYANMVFGSEQPEDTAAALGE